MMWCNNNNFNSANKKHADYKSLYFHILFTNKIEVAKINYVFIR